MTTYFAEVGKKAKSCEAFEKVSVNFCFQVGLSCCSRRKKGYLVLCELEQHVEIKEHGPGNQGCGLLFLLPH